MLIIKDYIGIAGSYQIALKHTQTSLVDIASVTIEGGGDVKKSREGKVALLGPLGLLAKRTQGSVAITVHKKDGEDAYYEVLGMTTIEVRGQLAPVLKAADIVIASEESAPTASSSVADELTKLVALHECGALNDEEFAEQKAKVLAG